MANAPEPRIMHTNARPHLDFEGDDVDAAVVHTVGARARVAAHQPANGH